MAQNAQASRLEIQNDYVSLILTDLYKALKKGKDNVDQAVEILSSLSLNTDHLKEHLMSLSFDQQIVKAFEDLDTQTKTAFTKAFNKNHKDNLTGKRGGGKKGAA